MLFEIILETFRCSVAPLTGEISLLLHAECEEYGMTKELYQNVMNYSRKFPQKFRAIIEIGNFKFEGENYDTNRRIVLSIGPFYLNLISTR